MTRVRLLSFAIENLSYLFSNETIRRILPLVPHKELQRLLDISDTMSQRAQEIIDQRKTALRMGDEAIKAEVGEGKDIMSICRACRPPDCHPLSDLVSECSQGEHGRHSLGADDGRRDSLACVFSSQFFVKLEDS